MKSVLVVFSGLFFLLFSNTVKAQPKFERQIWEFGLFGGAANYVGDIRPDYKELYNVFNPAAGAFLRINFHPRWAVRGAFTAGKTEGDDFYATSAFEKTRNLSFHSNVYEASIILEFNFFEYILRSKTDYFTPYLFVGVAGFHFNPKADYQGETYELQPLGTEGQQFPDFTDNEPYKLYDFAIPYGGGFKYNLTSNLTLGFEIGYRSTFTDYLDDISQNYVDPAIIRSGQNGPIAAALADRSIELASEPIGVPGRQRGDSKNNDAYIFSGISISYTFTNLLCPPPSGANLKRR